jgi:hypothetical protein
MAPVNSKPSVPSVPVAKPAYLTPLGKERSVDVISVYEGRTPEERRTRALEVLYNRGCSLKFEEQNTSNVTDAKKYRQIWMAGIKEFSQFYPHDVDDELECIVLLSETKQSHPEIFMLSEYIISSVSRLTPFGQDPTDDNDDAAQLFAECVTYVESRNLDKLQALRLFLWN